MHKIMHHSLYGWYKVTCHSTISISFALLFSPYIKPLCYAVELMYMQKQNSPQISYHRLPPLSFHLMSLFACLPCTRVDAFTRTYSLVADSPLDSSCFQRSISSCHCCTSRRAPVTPFLIAGFDADPIFVSLYRYLRLVVNLFAFYRLRPIPIPEIPRLTPKDVTVVIPSIGGDGEVLWETIRSILATEPFEIILVTIDANVTRAQLMVKHMGTSRVKIRSVPYPNKRRQMVRALGDIQTDITVFADDDVLWPPKLLPWMLAPLEDDSYGGVGTNQRLRRAEAPTFQQRVYGYLNALYLERRNFDCASCMYMDGGLPCLSGRTVAYRSTILKDKAFIEGFTREVWLGRYQLNADDDNFITRWLVSHDKKIGFQYHKEAEILTTLEDNPNFVKQCLRWSRSNWRSNITSMFCERHIWRLAAGPPKPGPKRWSMLIGS